MRASAEAGRRHVRTRVRCAGGRYRANGSSEARYEPGSNRRVLRNLMGIRSVREMDRVEQRGLFRTTEWALGSFRASHCFSATDVRRLHLEWLGGIYSWAGEYRQVNMSKGGFMFAAVRAGLERNYEPMARLFRSIVSGDAV